MRYGWPVAARIKLLGERVEWNGVIAEEGNAEYGFWIGQVEMG